MKKSAIFHFFVFYGPLEPYASLNFSFFSYFLDGFLRIKLALHGFTQGVSILMTNSPQFTFLLCSCSQYNLFYPFDGGFYSRSLVFSSVWSFGLSFYPHFSSDLFPICSNHFGRSFLPFVRISSDEALVASAGVYLYCQSDLFPCLFPSFGLQSFGISFQPSGSSLL